MVDDRFTVTDGFGVTVQAYRMSDGGMHLSVEPGCEKLSEVEWRRLWGWLSAQMPTDSGDCDEPGTEL
jgi:hypothetical protein